MAAKTPAQKREQEKQTVGLMIELYCHGHHGTRGHALCPDCEALRSYADARVDHCPHIETKTFCSACKTHCYKPQMREAIRQVMRWTGTIPEKDFFELEHALEVISTVLGSAQI